MNSAIFKVSNSNDINSSFRAALFHSTPPLQRKRRNHWDSVEWLATVWRRLSSNKFGPCSSLPLEEYVMGFRIEFYRVSVLPLVGIDSSIGPSSMRKILSGGVSDRLALGLSVSGPLKLEDVKNAYRPCALKWHPDRHQGSSKAVAEEKFELCSAAYQSLCDSLALD
ncbi:hypothetical protein D0Y65_007166 [Glycine soja]|uniref:J domain-containing protein n=1 Tax=Glycine soja TaxID=3848 RepID=A0A445LBM3_GLYSO|nr:hypothetical protein D0Y65_007166 [Glycine soja]